MPAPADVEFVINCFERNINLVTAPGFLTEAVAQHCFPFALRTLMVNNVEDRERAARQAQGCVDRGEVDRWVWVDDHLDVGLKATGLTRKDFGDFLHWSDCCVAAIALDGPNYICYVDVDLPMAQPHDWISEALPLMAARADVIAANPMWDIPTSPAASSEADEKGTGHFFGYGFTDQVFLAQRSDLRTPLLNRRLPLIVSCPVSSRFVGATHGMIFEQIMDAYMRRNRLQRVTLTTASFKPQALNTYAPRDLQDRILQACRRRTMAFLTSARRRNPNRLTDPRLRSTGLLDPQFPLQH